MQQSKVFEAYDLCTEDGGLVVGVEGETALLVHPDTGAKPQRVPVETVNITEVYSQEEVEPVALALPAPLLQVLKELETAEEREEA